MMRRYSVIFPVVKAPEPLYLRRWDTPPQRGALIWKDSINDDDETGIAAGQSAVFLWPLCQNPHILA